VWGARAALVRTRTMLVDVARGPTKSYEGRLRGCDARGMKPQAAQDSSPELKSALEPMMRESRSANGSASTIRCSSPWHGTDIQKQSAEADQGRER
jgi:hypothetical protein